MKRPLPKTYNQYFHLFQLVFWSMPVDQSLIDDYDCIGGKGWYYVGHGQKVLDG